MKEITDSSLTRNSATNLFKLSILKLEKYTTIQRKIMNKFNPTKNCNIIKVNPKDFSKYRDSFITFRLSIHKEFPYFYDGNRSEEELYFESLTKSKDTVFLVVTENEKTIGCILGTPLSESFDDSKKPFIENNTSIDTYFYFAEFLLDKEYRGLGLGSKMYDEFEKEVKALNKYDKITGLKVVKTQEELDAHPEFFSLDPFLSKRQYEKSTIYKSKIAWKEVSSEEKVIHDIEFWIKKI